MPKKKNRMRSGMLLSGLLALLLLAALPSTLAQYTSLDWGSGAEITAADYTLTAAAEVMTDELPVTVEARDLAIKWNAYDDDVIDAALAEADSLSETVPSTTTEVTLTAGGTASGYFAVHYGGAAYYSDPLEAGEHITLTVAVEARVIADQTEDSVFISTDNGDLAVEACWGAPPETGERIAALQTILDGQIAAQERQLESEAYAELEQVLTERLQAALDEQQRLADERAEQERLAAEQAERERLEAEAAAENALQNSAQNDGSSGHVSE